MNRIRNNLKIGKKALCLLLASIMVLSVMGGAFGSLSYLFETKAGAASSKASNVTLGEGYFVVPETIYLKPNEAGFDYYLNTTSSGTIDTDHRGDTDGYVRYSLPSNCTFTSITSKFYKASDFSFAQNSSVTVGSDGKLGGTLSAPAANTSYYLVWDLSYKDNNDGQQKHMINISYVYAPLVGGSSTVAQQVGTYCDRNDGKITVTGWITGIHGIEQNTDSTNRTASSGADAIGGMIDPPLTDNTVTNGNTVYGCDSNSVSKWLKYTEGNVGYSGWYNWSNKSTDQTNTLYSYYNGILYVDTSRFSNGNQIRNFIGGVDTGNYRNQGSQHNNNHYRHIGVSNSTTLNTTSLLNTNISSHADGDRQKFALNVSITSSTKYVTLGYDYKMSCDKQVVIWYNGYARCVGYVYCRIVPTDKSALRTAVFNATKLLNKLGVNGFDGSRLTSCYFDAADDTATGWKKFSDAYIAAVKGLTTVNASPASDLITNLNNAIKNLKIKVTIDKNTGIADGDSLAVYNGPSGVYYLKLAPTGSIISSFTLFSGDGTLYKADGSVAYSSYTAPTLYGYKFAGWSLNSSATSGTMTAPSAGYNQTWYCIWTNITSNLQVFYNKTSSYNSNLIYFKDNASTFTAGSESTITLNGSKQADGGIKITGTINDTGAEKTITTDKMCANLEYGKTYVIMFNSTNDGTDFYVYTQGSSMGVRSGRLKNPTKVCDGLWSYATVFTVGYNGGDTDAADRTWQNSAASSLTTTYNFRMSQSTASKGDYTVTDLRIFEDTTCSGTPDVTDTKKCNSSTTVADPSARTGYAFLGYTVHNAGKINTSRVFTFDGIEDATGKVLAHWRPIQYKITYDGNGNTSGSMDYTIHTYDSAKNLTTNAYGKQYTITYDYNDGFLKPNIVGEENNSKTADGSTTFTYSFAGWKWNGNTYTNGQSVSNLVTSAQNITFVAQWTSSPLALENPTRPGYTFLGWYTAADGGSQICAPNGTYTATANIKLYAHWQANSSNVTLQYHAKPSGMSDDAAITRIGALSVQATYGSNMYAPITTPQRTGYIFDGYYGLNGTKKFYNADGTSAHKWNITDTSYSLTPKWNPITYKIKYNGNGATKNDIPNQTMYFDTGANLSSGSGMERVYTVTFNINDKGQIKDPGNTARYTADTTTSSNASYIFKGWKRTDADSATGDWFVTGGGTTKKVDYSISDWAYNLTSVNNKVVEMTAQWQSQPVYMPSAPSRPGYTFGGWYENAECTGTKRDPGEAYTPTAAKTFYAKWTANTYTTTYVYDLENSKTGYTYKMTSDGTLSINGTSGASISPLVLYPFKPVVGHTYKVEIYNVSGTTGASNNRFVVEPTNASGTALTTRKNVETTNSNTSGTWNFSEADANTTERIKIWLYVASPDKAANFSCKVRVTDNTTGTVYNMCVDSDVYGDAYGTMPSATKTGYSFAGWYTERNKGGSAITSSTVNTNNANRTLYAGWNANTYVVKYNGNGGYTIDSKTNYQGSSSYTYDVNKNLENSKFTKNVTITYNYNAGTSAVYAVSDSGDYEAKNTSSETKSRDFKGWADTEDLAKAGTVNYTATQSVVNLAASGTKNVYAVWALTSTILPKVMRPGYTFEGWYKDAACNNPAEDSAGKNFAGDPYTYDDACTLYAKWSRIAIDNKVVAYDSVKDITADLIDQVKVFDNGVQTYGDVYTDRYDDITIKVGQNNRTGKLGIADVYNPSSEPVGMVGTTLTSFDDSSKIVVSGSGLDTKATFTPEKLTSEMTVFFVCQYRDYDVGPYQYVVQSISFVPANSIFLEEDSFVENDTFLETGEENEGSDWIALTGSKTEPGADVDNYLYLHDKVQGFSSAYSYNSSAEFSNGTALKTVVSPQDLVSKAVEYRYFGTGFDLYSDCGPETSDLVISIWKMDSATSTDGVLIETVTVDTCIEDESILTSGDDNNANLVRQIPVYHYMTAASGYYLIQVRAYYDPDTSSLAEEYGYIDGIRVYNRIDDESGYAASEQSAKFFNILQYTRNDNQPQYSEFAAPFTSVDASPVNEIYLAPAVEGTLSGTVFNLDGFKTSNNGKVMISLRAAAGTPIVRISSGTSVTAMEITLTHATEMYYDITSVVGNGDIYVEQVSSTGYAAICNLKITNSSGVQLTNSSVDLATAAERFEEIEDLEVVTYAPTDARPVHPTQPDIIIPGGEDEVVEYTVSFNANGHGTAPADQKVVKDGYATKPADPTTEDGYTFENWYTDEDCTDQWHFKKDAVTSDMVLYAKWTKNSTGGNDDGGDGNRTIEISIRNYSKVLSVEYWSQVTLHTNISAPEGYEIVWSNGQKGNKCTIDKIEKDMKIYAKVVNKNDSSDVIGQTETEEIKISNNNFFGKLLAIFKQIFKALPKYEDNEKVK